MKLDKKKYSATILGIPVPDVPDALVDLKVKILKVMDEEGQDVEKYAVTFRMLKGFKVDYLLIYRSFKESIE